MDPITFSYWFMFVFGLCMGSFLGVLVERLPNDRTIMGRSVCDLCKRTLSPFAMIPVLSYVATKGVSMCCNKKVSIFYPTFEILTGILYVLTYVWYSDTIGLLNTWSILELTAYLVVVSSLIVIFFADVKYHIIPDEMQIVLFISSFFIAGGLVPERLLAGFVLAGALFVLFLITKGKGLGFGDVKFAGVMGLLLGLKPGFIALYIAFVAGGIISTVLLLSKARTMKAKIAFGPFLIFGTAVMLFFGDRVTTFIDYLFF